MTMMRTRDDRKKARNNNDRRTDALHDSKSRQRSKARLHASRHSNRGRRGKEWRCYSVRFRWGVGIRGRRVDCDGDKTPSADHSSKNAEPFANISGAISDEIGPNQQARERADAAPAGSANKCTNQGTHECRWLCVSIASGPNDAPGPSEYGSPDRNPVPSFHSPILPRREEGGKASPRQHELGGVNSARMPARRFDRIVTDGYSATVCRSPARTLVVLTATGRIEISFSLPHQREQRSIRKRIGWDADGN